jgi:hypothetical protein
MQKVRGDFALRSLVLVAVYGDRMLGCERVYKPHEAIAHSKAPVFYAFMLIPLPVLGRVARLTFEPTPLLT